MIKAGKTIAINSTTRTEVTIVTVSDACSMFFIVPIEATEESEKRNKDEREKR